MRNECLVILYLLGCHNFPFTRTTDKRVVLRGTLVNPLSSKHSPSCPHFVVMQGDGRRRLAEIHKVTYLDYLISEVSEMEAGHLCGILISTDSF